MSDDFRLLMISAMFENGGNTTHRFLDGHPELYVYPYESQVGTQLVNDGLSSMWGKRYRWPVFDIAATPAEDYDAIIDQECKVRINTPHVSKFRDWPLEMTDRERREIYVEIINRRGRSRANNVAAFYEATFKAWKNHNGSGQEKVYVGYSPVIVLDALKILNDLPQAHVLHVVRNPWSAYADTKKRPVPESLDKYMQGWTLNNQIAFLAKKRFPDRMHIIRTEDTMANSQETLGELCETLGLERSDTLARTSWNGQPLEELYPWGTIRIPTPESNFATANELSDKEKAQITEWTEYWLGVLGYSEFLEEGAAEREVEAALVGS